jgi:DNA repair photolyase
MFSSVGWTWNPLCGCSHGCPYCWAKSLTDRWGKSFEPQFRSHFLKDKMPDDGSWIFVGSMGDIFCPGMKDEWILSLLYFIKQCEADNKFLLQTKNPFSFLAFGLEIEDIKDKVILGTTIETNRRTLGAAEPTYKRYKCLRTMRQEGFKTFLSMEPLADFDLETIKEWVFQLQPEAIELGLENYTHYLTPPPEKKIVEGQLL